MPSDGRLPLSWLRRLVTAHTPDEVGAAIAAVAQASPGCTEACVIWGLGDPLRRHSAPPVGTLDAADEDWLDAAARTDQPQWHPDRQRVALRLCEQPEPACLLLRLHAATDPAGFLDALAPSLQLAGQHLQRALEWAGLKDSHKQLERSENLQRALFAISDLAGSERDMPEMLRGIHAIVSTLMYAENLFIVLHNAEQDTIRFLYFVDVEDSSPPGDGQDMPLSAIEYTLTWYVMRDGKARMGNAEELRSQVPGPVAMVGTDSYDWLGVPMLRDGKPGGALVVQSYQQNIGFSDEDLALLEFVGSHILTALERKQSKEDLEQRVQLSTLQLAEANRGLQMEILERQRAEHAIDAVTQVATVGQAGERIVHHLMAQLILHALALDDLLAQGQGALLHAMFQLLVGAFQRRGGATPGEAVGDL